MRTLTLFFLALCFSTNSFADGETTPAICEKDLLEKISSVRKISRGPKFDGESASPCFDEALKATRIVSGYPSVCETIEFDDKRPIVEDIVETFRSALTHRERWSHSNVYAFSELREMLDWSLVYPLVAKCMTKIGREDASAKNAKPSPKTAIPK